jgi:four helix bundle protein
MGNSEIHSYRDLDAWRVSMDLSVLVYRAVKGLPDTERFELSSQMRRAGVSVPSNVAEGQACGEDGRYIHHLRIALGSLGELSTHVEIVRRLGLLPETLLPEIEEQLGRTGQVLHGLLRSRLKKRRLRTGSALLACGGFWFYAVAFLG